jgi:DnaJ like chaperone protein
MLTRSKSGALSALIVLGGLAFLVALVAAPMAAYAVLWLTAEIRALRHKPKQDFATFELDPFDAARLSTAREAAGDIVERLSDIEAGRVQIAEPEAETDHLIEQYRKLRSLMTSLQELPIRRLKKWSSAKALVSACRIGAVCVPLLSLIIGLVMLRSSGTLTVDPYRILAGACAGWIVLGLPLVFQFRKQRIERALGDRELFFERWRPQDDFLDFYLNRTERTTPEREEEPVRGEPKPTPDVPTSPNGGRPKRPWYVVLEVDPDAPASAIKRAYHERLMEYHPDKVARLGVEIRNLAEVVTREITAAYEEAGRHR